MRNLIMPFVKSYPYDATFPHSRSRPVERSFSKTARTSSGTCRSRFSRLRAQDVDLLLINHSLLDDIIPKKTNLKRLHDGTWRLRPFFTKTAVTPRQLIPPSFVLAPKNRRMAIFISFNSYSPVFARSLWPISLSTAILGSKWCAPKSF